MKIEPPQGVCLIEIYNHLKEFVSWRYNYLKEFISWGQSHLKEFVLGSWAQALKLDISRSSSHGSLHKLSISTYQGVRRMDLGTNFQAQPIKEFVSWILVQAFKLDIN